MKKQIEQLQARMRRDKIDIYLIPTSDYHQSEYVRDFFKAKDFLSGFTGSAGTLVVTADTAGIWTDGRYFIQASHQLKQSGIVLHKMGEPEVLSVIEYVRHTLKEGQTIGFDGRTMEAKQGISLERIARDVQGKINWNNDLIGEIWTDRPAIFGEPVFCLAEQYSGKSTKEKLAAVRRQMKQLGADVHVLTTLDDIAWLFNIRGNDIPCNPVALCYAVLTAETAHLFIHEQAVFEAVRKVLKQDNIELQPYDAIYDYVRKIDASKTILLDAERINYAIYKSISGTIVDEMNPEIEMKAIKNPVEIENLKNCHIKDGVAVTKFLYWIKNAIGKQNITEMSASDYLEDRRKEQSHFMELSFDTISAYGEHAAMMHYSATEESNAKLSPKGMLLVDSGGQYLEGTTDITRTVVLGFVTDQMKQHYTAVVRGMLNLASIQFLQGCRGGNLDILAREPLWNLGLDYRCGTGHGVGYFLNVHEPPNQFRWRTNGGMDQSAVLKEGMITTDEPGVYLENQYGIRIENELLCCKGIQNEYGQFLYFEPLTYAPIDLDGIDPAYMNDDDINRLNNYHRAVYEKISPYLTTEESTWLAKYTQPISKKK